MHWNAAPEISSTDDFYLCCWRKKRGGVFLYGWGFFPSSLALACKRCPSWMSKPARSAGPLIPAHAGCDSGVTTSVPPQHALQRKTSCYRASTTSLQSQTRTFYFNLRLCLKKSIVVSSAWTTAKPPQILRQMVDWCREAFGDPHWKESAALFVPSLMTNESQQLGSGFVSKTLRVWPKVLWLTSPSSLLGSCMIRQMPIVMERHLRYLKKEYESQKPAFRSVIYVPQWELFPSELCRWDSIARWVWAGVPRGAPSATSRAFGQPFSLPHKEVRYRS